MDAETFDATIAKAARIEERIAWFGALLSKEARTRVEIVGGSAIEIYLSSDQYTSDDVDLVGQQERISRVLGRWKFRRLEGRDQRIYWFKDGIGLVDLVGAGDRSGLRPQKIETPYGPALISAVEPLILRRLVRAHREGSPELFDQAVKLATERQLDWDYLTAMANYERISSLLRRLRKRVQG